METSQDIGYVMNLGTSLLEHLQQHANSYVKESIYMRHANNNILKGSSRMENLAVSNPIVLQDRISVRNISLLKSYDRFSCMISRFIQ